MSWTNIWFFVVPFLIAAALPGPAQGTLVATVMARGRASSLLFVAGMVAGNSLWLIATILGLASLALRYESVFVAVKWMGVAYLLFVAWKLWSAIEVVESFAGVKSKGIFAGALLTLGNPKAVVFFGAILPQAFDLSVLTLAEATLIVALGTFIDAAIQTAYVIAALKVRSLIREPAQMRLVNRTAATAIGACAVLIAKRS